MIASTVHVRQIPEAALHQDLNLVTTKTTAQYLYAKKSALIYGHTNCIKIYGEQNCGAYNWYLHDSLSSDHRVYLQGHWPSSMRP